MASSDAPPGVDLNEDIRWTILGPVITLVILATAAVALRVASRKVSNLQLQWDDYLIMGALVFAYGTCALTIVGCYEGIGKHIWSPKVNLTAVLQCLWAYEFLYDTIIPFIKLSIILFYRRVFDVPRFQRVLNWLAVLVMGWWLAILLVVIFQCMPYSYFWLQYTDPTAKGKCINTTQFYIGNAAASVVTDFLILFCPIPMVWGLQMPVAQKISVLGIFALGGFVCVAGTVRLYALTLINKSSDLTWSLNQTFIWTSVEPCIGIVSACLPTLLPLIRRCFPRFFGRSNHQDSKPTYEAGAAARSRDQGGDFYPLHNGPKLRPEDELELTTNIEGSDFQPQYSTEDGIDRYRGIHVKHDIEWKASTVL
ncbi:hypothetical protein DTO027B5_1033 [Paecilomyces variotii]|nr:hypothetical protein DTO169E5_4733 [Paecilomyces variotii]KAJ9248907.1 hypothetical protein DTO207G8_7109 [Paecilomyces variotii]KAJ9272667.1 hypothetical protein DTO212C5_1394 [Paecilomyces variotii]KAJ9328178.1 hypothetical protein DTO027B3_1215 [Paecilomyces variotii]KAJ9337235.1 hypothetical protein DTO027B5_1033 [Paecilomyces variotii]